MSIGKGAGRDLPDGPVTRDNLTVHGSWFSVSIVSLGGEIYDDDMMLGNLTLRFEGQMWLTIFSLFEGALPIWHSYDTLARRKQPRSKGLPPRFARQGRGSKSWIRNSSRY